MGSSLEVLRLLGPGLAKQLAQRGPRRRGQGLGKVARVAWGSAIKAIRRGSAAKVDLLDCVGKTLLRRGLEYIAWVVIFEVRSASAYSVIPNSPSSQMMSLVSLVRPALSFMAKSDAGVAARSDTEPSR